MGRINDFRTGLVIPQGLRINVSPSALLTADNVEYFVQEGDDKGVVRVRGRRGFAEFGSVPGQVIFMHRFYGGGLSATLAGSYDGDAEIKIYHDINDDGVFGLAGGAASGYLGPANWNWVNWASQSHAYGVDGEGDFVKYQVGTVTSITPTGVAVDGPYIHLYRDRLYVTYSQEPGFSVYASDILDPETFQATNQLNVGDSLGGSITGLSSYGDYLGIFKTTGVWRFVGDTEEISNTALQELIPGEGCTSPKSIAKTPYGILYAGKHGIYLTDLQSPIPVKMSAPIDGLWKALTSQTIFTNARGVWYPRKEMYVFQPTPGSAPCYTLQRLPWVSLTDGTIIGIFWLWAKHTTHNQTSSCVWAGDDSFDLLDDGRMIYGDLTGTIYHFDIGTTDNEEIIFSVIETAPRLLTNLDQDGRVYSVKTFSRRKNPLALGIRYDGATMNNIIISYPNTLSSAGYAADRTTIVDQTQLGKYVHFVLTASDGPDFEFHRADYDQRTHAPRRFV